MRFVSKDLNDIPDILVETGTITSLIKVIISAGPDNIQDKFFRGNYVDGNGLNQSKVADKLNEYYHFKCAYCETICKPEIEHYRPKGEVSSGVGTPKTLGYYWLCYEWSNLIPSCHDCNNRKGIQFPVRAVRATPPQLTIYTIIPNDFSSHKQKYISEQPYLIHPELDDPAIFLGAQIDPNLNGINIVGLDGHDMRGEKTIKICDLNRKDLQLKRLEVLNNFINSVNYLFEMLSSQIISSEKFEAGLLFLFEKLNERSRDEKEQYSLMHKYILESVEHFNQIVLPLFEAAQRPIIKVAFEKYKI